MSAIFERCGRNKLTIAAMFAGSLLLTAGAQAQVGHNLDVSLSEAEFDAGIISAIPMERLLSTLPRERRSGKLGTPGLTDGLTGGADDLSGLSFGAPPEGSGASPENYGQNKKNTIYHYNDYLQEPYPAKYYPQRAVGYFYFKASNNKWYHCTAALIKRSILVTAGHCVHDGGNKGAGWIKSAKFYPARSGNTYPYGYCTVRRVYTTSGWYNNGQLDKGYDVGLAVCNKRKGTSKEMGQYTGYFGFCYSNCLQKYWFMTQIGYPGNYYSGTYMTVSQHLEKSDGYDYRYGTGMEGGSSGGPHVSNIGRISDSSSNKGYYTSRNIIFDVTSWGYTSHNPKIQGASPLSGRNNANNFKGMYNTACTYARRVHGTSSCGLL